ncbi:hypothetical protein [Colwellia sp. MEBiC06753]
MAQMQIFRIAIFTLAILLVGCGDPVKEQITAQIPLTEQRVQQLGNMLDNGEVRNAKFIGQYADKIIQLKPELTELANEFKKDATSQGPMYRALVERVDTVKNQPQMFGSSQARFEELVNIYQAADPVLFSDALSDPLNVLADMSGGTLPRINAMSRAQSIAANNAQDFGLGEQLIGNPAYGQWQTDSNGMSFWAWYGMYRMLGDVMDLGFGRRGRLYYSDWGRYRNYSYYHDYGRSRYSSPTQLNKQTQLETRTRKSFESRGQKFNSAYSKNRSGASGVSSQSKTAQASANRFRTNSTNKSSYASKTSSSYGKNASFRNSSSSTSRGFRRGK